MVTREWKLEVTITGGSDEWWELKPSHEELIEQVLKDLEYYEAKVKLKEYKETM